MLAVTAASPDGGGRIPAHRMMLAGTPPALAFGGARVISGATGALHFVDDVDTGVIEYRGVLSPAAP